MPQTSPPPQSANTDFLASWIRAFADNSFENITEATFRDFATAINTTFAPAAALGTVARCHRETITAVAAGTPHVITHNLNAESVQVAIFQNGAPVLLAISISSSSALTLTSSTALTSLHVLVIG